MRTTLTLILAMSLLACTSATAPTPKKAPVKASHSGFTITAGRDGGLICVDTETGQEVPMENCI